MGLGLGLPSPANSPLAFQSGQRGEEVDTHGWMMLLDCARLSLALPLEGEGWVGVFGAGWI
ncbi:MAG TPA: hypothetical protein PLL48_12955, partial [Novosphingobium sp.]|nr:hypothetical protein [Novosphingobium sp.]